MCVFNLPYFFALFLKALLTEFIWPITPRHNMRDNMMGFRVSTFVSVDLQIC